MTTKKRGLGDGPWPTVGGEMLRLSPQEVEALDQLLRVGLHGETWQEVALTLIRRGLLEALRDGLIALRRPRKRS